MNPFLSFLSFYLSSFFFSFLYPLLLLLLFLLFLLLGGATTEIAVVLANTNAARAHAQTHTHTHGGFLHSVGRPNGDKTDEDRSAASRLSSRPLLRCTVASAFVIRTLPPPSQSLSSLDIQLVFGNAALQALSFRVLLACPSFSPLHGESERAPR